MNRMALGIVLGLAMTAGAYAVAARGAKQLATAFVATETSSHSRNVDFAAAASRISTAHKAGRAKCDALAGKQKRACASETWSREWRGPATALHP